MTIPGTLKRAINGDRVAHAYLFYGRRCDEYTDLILEFFARLVCDQHPDTACGTCSSCQQIQALSYSDLVTINPPENIDADIDANNAGRIGVEQVREDVVSAVSLTSTESDYKLFWLNNMADFTSEASNALLKVLEEPPGSAVFVLTARSLGDCLPTIRSRCQWIRMSPESIDEQDIQDTCLNLWPGETWDDEDFQTWAAVLNGEQRSSQIDWTQSLARGFLTFLLLLIHRKYTNGPVDPFRECTSNIDYRLLPDILDRFQELDQGGQPEFVVNSLLESIYFPGETSECRHVI